MVMRDVRKIFIKIGNSSYCVNLETGNVIEYVYSKGSDEDGDIEEQVTVGKIVRTEEAL